MSVSRSVRVVLIGGLSSFVWGCSSQPYYVAKPEPWRDEEETACLSAHAVRETPWVKTRSALGGPEFCGAMRPFEMAATEDGNIRLNPPALLRCPMVPQVDRWLGGVVSPAARFHLGAPVIEISVAASYACRPMNNEVGAKLSEHGHANAIDISAFTLADGRKITVRSGWYGDPHERAFLQAIHDAACREFTTVLGPEFNALHRDHFHLDLARHGQDGLNRVCK
jgi:hypothetical protein